MSETVEPSREPAFQITGGLRWGEGEFFSRRAGWPCARLRATAEQLVIEVSTLFPRTFVLPCERVRRIESGWRRLSPGVCIEHEDTLAPVFLHFVTFDGRYVVSELRKLGYPVDEQG